MMPKLRLSRSKAHGVTHVFIGGASIGGLASGTPGLKALLRDGSLRDKLKAAGAL